MQFELQVLQIFTWSNFLAFTVKKWVARPKNRIFLLFRVFWMPKAQNKLKNPQGLENRQNPPLGNSELRRPIQLIFSNSFQ